VSPRAPPSAGGADMEPQAEIDARADRTGLAYVRKAYTEPQAKWLAHGSNRNIDQMFRAEGNTPK
jgi:hypothetical protein